jgi:hypothetical protein
VVMDFNVPRDSVPLEIANVSLAERHITSPEPVEPIADAKLLAKILELLSHASHSLVTFLMVHLVV